MNGRIDGLNLNRFRRGLSQEGNKAKNAPFGRSRAAQLCVHHGVAHRLHALAGSRHKGRYHLGREIDIILGQPCLCQQLASAGTGSSTQVAHKVAAHHRIAVAHQSVIQLTQQPAARAAADRFGDILFDRRTRRAAHVAVHKAARVGVKLLPQHISLDRFHHAAHIKRGSNDGQRGSKRAGHSVLIRKFLRLRRPVQIAAHVDYAVLRVGQMVVVFLRSVHALLAANVQVGHALVFAELVNVLCVITVLRRVAGGHDHLVRFQVPPNGFAGFFHLKLFQTDCHHVIQRRIALPVCKWVQHAQRVQLVIILPGRKNLVAYVLRLLVVVVVLPQKKILSVLHVALKRSDITLDVFHLVIRQMRALAFQLAQCEIDLLDHLFVLRHALPGSRRRFLVGRALPVHGQRIQVGRSIFGRLIVARNAEQISHLRQGGIAVSGLHAGQRLHPVGNRIALGDVLQRDIGFIIGLLRALHGLGAFVHHGQQLVDLLLRSRGILKLGQTRLFDFDFFVSQPHALAVLVLAVAGLDFLTQHEDFIVNAGAFMAQLSWRITHAGSSHRRISARHNQAALAVGHVDVAVFIVDNAQVVQLLDGFILGLLGFLVGQNGVHRVHVVFSRILVSALERVVIAALRVGHAAIHRALDLRQIGVKIAAVRSLKYGLFLVRASVRNGRAASVDRVIAGSAHSRTGLGFHLRQAQQIPHSAHIFRAVDLRILGQTATAHLKLDILLAVVDRAGRAYQLALPHALVQAVQRLVLAVDHPQNLIRVSGRFKIAVNAGVQLVQLLLRLQRGLLRIVHRLIHFLGRCVVAGQNVTVVFKPVLAEGIHAKVQRRIVQRAAHGVRAVRLAAGIELRADLLVLLPGLARAQNGLRAVSQRVAGAAVASRPDHALQRVLAVADGAVERQGHAACRAVVHPGQRLVLRPVNPADDLIVAVIAVLAVRPVADLLLQGLPLGFCLIGRILRLENLIVVVRRVLLGSAALGGRKGSAAVAAGAIVGFEPAIFRQPVLRNAAAHIHAKVCKLLDGLVGGSAVGIVELAGRITLQLRKSLVQFPCPLRVSLRYRVDTRRRLAPGGLIAGIPFIARFHLRQKTL